MASSEVFECLTSCTCGISPSYHTGMSHPIALVRPLPARLEANTLQTKEHSKLASRGAFFLFCAGPVEMDLTDMRRMRKARLTAWGATTAVSTSGAAHVQAGFCPRNGSTGHNGQGRGNRAPYELNHDTVLWLESASKQFLLKFRMILPQQRRTFPFSRSSPESRSSISTPLLQPSLAAKSPSLPDQTSSSRMYKVHFAQPPPKIQYPMTQKEGEEDSTFFWYSVRYICSCFRDPFCPFRVRPVAHLLCFCLFYCVARRVRRAGPRPLALVVAVLLEWRL
jgi:hypothetical protein